MMPIVIEPDGDRYRWRLVRRTPAGADVLARGACAYPDEGACHRAAEQLAAVSGEAMLVVQQPDGHWCWQVTGADGHLLAESPALFADAATCGRALSDLRREVAGLASVPS